jgi:hypothetical protein
MMNAAVKIADAEPAVSLQDFRECATDYARFYRTGVLEKADAVDCAQRHAELWGVVDLYGQDAVQAEMAAAFTEAPPILPEPEKHAYRTPQATIDAFLHKARTENAEQVANWLELHPRDVSTLRKVWKEKCQIR